MVDQNIRVFLQYNQTPKLHGNSKPVQLVLGFAVLLVHVLFNAGSPAQVVILY